MPVTSIKPTKNTDGMTEFGRVYMGAQKTDPKRPGAKLSYFRFEPNPQHPLYTPVQLLAAWEATYGKEAQTINDILFLSDNIDHLFDNWFELYGRSSKQALLIRRCTGDECVKHREDGGMSHQPVPCICVMQGLTGDDRCGQTGRLFMWLRELAVNLARMTGISSIGLVVMVSHGKTGLTNIRAALARTEALFGRYMNVAHRLDKRLHRIETPNGMVNMEWIPFLDFASGATDTMLLPEGESMPAQRPALPTAPARAALAANNPPATPHTSAGRYLGTSTRLVIKSASKIKYSLRLDHNDAPIPLSGFDGIRALGSGWAVEDWKTQADGHYDIPAIAVTAVDGGFLFEDPNGGGQ